MAGYYDKGLKGYEGLAEAIIDRAIKDYRRAVFEGRNPPSLVEFFRSGYFMMLAESCGLELNGNDVMKGVQDAVNKKKMRKAESNQ